MDEDPGALLGHVTERVIYLYHRLANQPTNNQIKCIYIALRTSADISKCCTETQPKTPKQQAMQV